MYVRLYEEREEEGEREKGAKVRRSEQNMVNEHYKVNGQSYPPPHLPPHQLFPTQ
jgi:hypothetical protein